MNNTLLNKLKKRIISISLSMLICLNLVTYAKAAELSWQPVGNEGFSIGSANYTSLAIAQDGSLYVAYVDTGSSSPAMMHYINGNWTSITRDGFSSGAVTDTSLAIAPDGTPYVVYQDIAMGNSVTVKKYVNGSWQAVGIAGFSGAAAYDPSIAIAPDGTPYVAYQDNGNSFKATVMKFSYNEWVPVGGAGFSPGQANYASIDIAKDGTPYVVFRDGSKTGKATVMKYADESWTAVGTAGFSAGMVDGNTLKIAPDGTLYVSFKDFGNNRAATVMKYAGEGWEAVGNPGFSVSEVESLSLAIGPDGAPYTAYVDYESRYRATVMKYADGSWSPVGNAGFTPEFSQFTSLAISKEGVPYVAYRDALNYNNATVMMYGTAPIPVYTLSYTSGVGGTITGTASQTVNSGESGTKVTAVANAGYHFTGWSDGITAADRTDSNVSGNINVTANFAINQYTLSYSAGTNGSLTGNASQTVNHGNNGTEVTAVANAGYHFTGWSDGVTTPSRTDSNVRENMSVTASFAISQYKLNYAAGANGTLTGTASQTLNYGESGTEVIATANPGYHFVSWSDGLTTPSRIDGDVSKNISVTASFAINQYTLTYSAGANGGLTGNASQTIDHGNNGTEVTAVANPGYHFTGWSDGVTTPSRTDSNASGNMSVSASFSINQYGLNYAAGTNGTLTGTASQTLNHGESGTEVTAVADPGYHFVSWSDGITTPSRIDGSVSGNISVTANFAINQYTLTYAAGANGSLTGTASQTVNYGNNGTTVTASANPGYHFTGWSDGVTTSSRTDSNVAGNLSVTANFAINEYTLTYEAGSNGSLTGAASQTVNEGESGSEVTAAANPGYHFTGWSDGVTTSSRTDSNITENLSVTANFAINEYTLTYAAGTNGSLTGTVSQTVNYGNNGTTVTAVANTGYHFLGWSDRITTPSRTDSNIRENMSVTANFEINSYTVTFKDYNGDAIGIQQTVRHGSAAAVPSAPTRTGYVFAGWDKSFDAVKDNLIVTATYTSKITYEFQADKVSENTTETKTSIGYLESRDNTLVVKNNISSLSIPSNAIDIDGISRDGYIKVTEKVINDNTKATLLSSLPAGIEAVGNPLNLKVQLFDGNDAFLHDIHQFANNEKIKVTIKLTADHIKGLDTTKLSMYYYNETTKAWEEVGGSFDAETMNFTFYTPHFSIFAIMQKTVSAPDPSTLPKTGSLIDFNATISLGGILLFAGAILLLRKKRKGLF
jgi:uncharacterized repeat protein (TIGR02543 family)/LPXTG-motif cell wall-anchored protein